MWRRAVQLGKAPEGGPAAASSDWANAFTSIGELSHTTEGTTATGGVLTRRTVAAAALWSVRVASSITSGSAAGYVDGSMVMSPSRTGSSNRNFVPSAAGAQQAVGTQGKSHGQGSGFTVQAGTTQSTNAGGYVPVTVTNLSSSSLSLTYSNPGTVTSGGLRCTTRSTSPSATCGSATDGPSCWACSGLRTARPAPRTTRGPRGPRPPCG